MICCKTGDAGKDATGLMSDDSIWGSLWVLPYVARYPDLAWVVEYTPEDGSTPYVAGYIVCAPDTNGYNDWFISEWWPSASARYTRPPPPAAGEEPSREYKALNDGDTRVQSRGGEFDYSGQYPAHLHIDLLPEIQGKGLGRRLIMTLLDTLRRKGVKGLHLGTQEKNKDACAFYEKMGFKRVPGKAGSAMFAMNFIEQ